jgi:predicted  nucleic acid-binding Zn-ribbon protein
MSAIAIAAMSEELTRLKAARENKTRTVELALRTAEDARNDLRRINKDIQDLELAIHVLTNHMGQAA